MSKSLQIVSHYLQIESNYFANSVTLFANRVTLFANSVTLFAKSATLLKKLQLSKKCNCFGTGTFSNFRYKILAIIAPNHKKQTDLFFFQLYECDTGSKMIEERGTSGAGSTSKQISRAARTAELRWAGARWHC